jgi:hypothetical protein
VERVDAALATTATTAASGTRTDDLILAPISMGGESGRHDRHDGHDGHDGSERHAHR